MSNSIKLHLKKKYYSTSILDHLQIPISCGISISRHAPTSARGTGAFQVGDERLHISTVLKHGPKGPKSPAERMKSRHFRWSFFTGTWDDMGASNKSWDRRAWYFLVGGIPTPLKNITQIGSSSQLVGKIKNVPNHQPVFMGAHWILMLMADELLTILADSPELS